MIKNIEFDTNKIADKSMALWGEIFSMSYREGIVIDEIIQDMKDILNKKKR